jgi:hypothetical protein
MHQFNNCKFILSEDEQTMWQDEQNQIIPYDSNVHGKMPFKKKSLIFRTYTPSNTTIFGLPQVLKYQL